MGRMKDLFGDEMYEARTAKKDGMDRVESHAAPDWTLIMYELALAVARQKLFFTSDDVFDLADQRPGMPSTHDLRAFGPVMMKAARNGVCRKANVAPVASRRASLHASPRAVWQSLIFRR